jgi:hypothetical protein
VSCPYGDDLIEGTGVLILRSDSISATMLSRP